MLQKTPLNEMKRQPTEWDKIFANHISDKKMFSEYIENSYNSITKNNKNIKVKKRILVDIYPRKIYNGQKAHKKILKIISHQGNRNQNY